MGGHDPRAVTPGTAEPGSGEPAGAGPVLIAGEAALAVIESMRTLNDGLQVFDRGSYLRVSAPGGCRLTRVAVERKLGRPFRLPGDLEALMPSFRGRFRVDETEARWEIP